VVKQTGLAVNHHMTWHHFWPRK